MEAANKGGSTKAPLISSPSPDFSFEIPPSKIRVQAIGKRPSLPSSLKSPRKDDKVRNASVSFDLPGNPRESYPHAQPRYSTGSDLESGGSLPFRRKNTTMQLPPLTLSLGNRRGTIAVTTRTNPIPRSKSMHQEVNRAADHEDMAGNSMSIMNREIGANRTNRNSHHMNWINCVDAGDMDLLIATRKKEDFYAESEVIDASNPYRFLRYSSKEEAKVANRII